MKKFDIPDHYHSSIVSKIKSARKDSDPRKKDYTPTELDFGRVKFYIARHFGFCYGVENAIEIAYKTVEENPGKRIFLISEMIHNPLVNKDLNERGIQFLADTHGKQYIDWNELSADDIVLIPAFGTTIETENLLREKGIQIEKYDTTCPFVEKVWNRAWSLGESDFTVVIHGKKDHEETRATFSHSVRNAKSVIVRDLEETKLLGKYISGELPPEGFFEDFAEKYSEGFNPLTDLSKIGVVNQTTMLASETQEIASYLKKVIVRKFGEANYKEHFADTRDTLCYATNDNQRATLELLNTDADLAVVVGGYNSSNTSHIVELLEEKFPTYFISSDEKIATDGSIRHWNLTSGEEQITENFLPEKQTVQFVLTSGASCPDSVVDKVLTRLLSLLISEEEIQHHLRKILNIN